MEGFFDYFISSFNSQDQLLLGVLLALLILEFSLVRKPRKRHLI